MTCSVAAPEADTRAAAAPDWVNSYAGGNDLGLPIVVKR